MEKRFDSDDRAKMMIVRSPHWLVLLRRSIRGARPSDLSPYTLQTWSRETGTRFSGLEPNTMLVQIAPLENIRKAKRCSAVSMSAPERPTYL